MFYKDLFILLDSKRLLKVVRTFSVDRRIVKVPVGFCRDSARLVSRLPGLYQHLSVLCQSVQRFFSGVVWLVGKSMIP